MKTKQITFKIAILVAAFVVVSVAHAQTGGGWSNPTATPPGNNVSAPVHVGSEAQTKAGGFAVSGAASGLRIFDRANTTESWQWYANRDTATNKSWLRLWNHQDLRDQVTIDPTGMRLFGNLWSGGVVSESLQVTGGAPAAGKALVATNEFGNSEWRDISQSLSSAVYRKRINSTSWSTMPNKLYADNPTDIILSCGGATSDLMTWDRSGNGSDRSLWYLYPSYPTVSTTENPNKLPYCRCGQNDPNEEDRYTHGCGLITGVFMKVQ